MMPLHKISRPLRHFLYAWLLCCLAPIPVYANEAAARQAMENPADPLVLIETSQGDIFVELFPDETPQNVTRFLALVNGEVEIRDPDTGQSYFPRYYDGMRFHRVLPGFLIQAGSPAKHPLGEAGTPLANEINAEFLGLDAQTVILPDGTLNPLLNIGNRSALENQILLPLYRQLRIGSNEDVQTQQFAIADRLRSMTLRQAYENLGYRYDNSRPTRGVSRGVLALANQGPNSNGSEFFIPVVDAHWLNGLNTVIGQVVDGMETVDRINSIAIDPLSNSRQSTLIFSVRNLE